MTSIQVAEAKELAKNWTEKLRKWIPLHCKGWFV